MERSIRALTVLMFCVGVCVGCGDGLPGGPSDSRPKEFALTLVTPVEGSMAGGTNARLVGTGFPAAAMTLTVGGARVVDYVRIDSTRINFTTPAHVPGAVDIVLTSPSGDVSQLAGAFTYVGPPVVTGLSPARVSTEGSPLYIKGTGFTWGTTVTIDGARMSATFYVDTLYTSAPLHAVGAVEVVVTNPDGQSVRLPGALTYATPESFDLSGDWEGIADNGSHDGTVIRFTIQDNVMVSLSCGTGADLLPVPAPSVAKGRISSVGGSVTGRITSEGVAEGKIVIAPCGDHVWGAGKR